MRFQVESSGVPQGSYPVAFAHCKPSDNQENIAKYGHGVVLTWTVTAGENAGVEVSVTCGIRLTANTNLGRFAAGLKSSPIVAGEGFDFADYIGVRGTLHVGPNTKGSIVPLAFVRDLQQQPQPVQPQQQPMPQQLQSAYVQPSQPPSADSIPLTGQPQPQQLQSAYVQPSQPPAEMMF